MQLYCPHCNDKCDRAVQLGGKSDAELFLVVCTHCAYILVLGKDTLRRPTAMEWDAVISNPQLFEELKQLQQTVERFIYGADPNQRPN